MTPEAVEEQVRRRRPSATPSSRRWSARPPTTCPACPASGRRPRRSGSTSTTASTTSSPTPTRSRARPASRCASTSATCIRNRRLNALVRDLDARPLTPDRPGGASRGTASEVHRLFDSLEFRVLRDRLFETLDVRGGGRRVRLRARRRPCSAPGEVAGWLDRARAGRRAGSGVARAGHAGARGTGDVVAARARRRPTGRRPGSTSSDARPRGRRGARAPGSPTPAGPRCCTTPRARCWRWRPRLAAGRAGRATPRSRRTSSGPTSAPTTWPT